MDVASGRPCSSNASYHHHHLSHPGAGSTLPELRRLNSNNYKGGAAALLEVPPLDMNLMNGDFLGIDDLLDFTNDDIGGPIEQGEASCTVDHDVEPTAVLVPAHDHQGPKACSTNSTTLSPAGAGLFDSEGGPGHLCVPCDDLADLEWLSNFVEDSFSSGGDEAACNIFGTSKLGVGFDAEDVDHCKRTKKSRSSFDGDDIGDNGSNSKSQQRSGSPVSVLLDNSSSTITSTTSSSTTTTTASDGGAIMSGKLTHASRGTVSRGVGSKPRSKRPRPAAVCFWNTRILSNDGCGSVLLHPPRQQQQESHDEAEEEEEEDDDTMSPSHCDDDDQSDSEYDSDAPAAPRFFIGSSHTSASPYYYDHVAGRKVPAHQRSGGSSSSSNKKQLYRTPPRGGAGSAGTATKRQQQQQKKKKKAPAQWDCDDDVSLQQPPVRRCLHCAAQKTPQWRAGPMGPKTLCNACGVRYKSGRLLPEYRPAASPTFVETIHSNSHRRVLEMRRQRYEQPSPSLSTSAAAPAPPPPPPPPLPPRQQAPLPRIITTVSPHSSSSAPKTVASPSPSPSPSSSSSGLSLEQPPPSSASPQHNASYQHLHPHHHHRPPSSAVISMAGVSC